METTASARNPVGADRRRPPHLALSGLVGLLLAEVLVLTLRFDSQALVDGGLPLVGYARYLPQALMAVAAAALVFGGPGLAAGGAELERPRRARGGPGRWAYLLAHLAAFAALVALTGAVWEGPLGPVAGRGGLGRGLAGDGPGDAGFLARGGLAGRRVGGRWRGGRRA